MTQQTDPDLREQVRTRYAAAALQVSTGGHNSCCGDGCGCGPTELDEPGFGGNLYSGAERAELPAEAVEASLGCGNPLVVADLHEGDTVLDLGSGGGIDVLLSARRVGPNGRAYGLDMTEEMLELARANAAKANARNVEFLKGTIEDIPLPDRNCRCRDLQLRHQPIHRQTRRLRRNIPGTQARRSRWSHRCRGRRPPHRCRPLPTRQLRRLHRRRTVHQRVPRRPCRRRLHGHRHQPHPPGRRRHALRDHPRHQTGPCVRTDSACEH